MKKTAILALATLPLISSCAGGTGSRHADDGEQTLEVFAIKLGFGSDWCKNLLDAFEKEDWVKEKYPNLKVYFETSADRSAIGTRLSAGEGVNTVDLVFSDGLSGYLGKDNMGKEYSVNLTNTVYNTKVPGEDVTVYEKLQDDYKKDVMYFEYGQSAFDNDLPFNSYSFYWGSGMMGIVYNEEILRDSFGYSVPPRTTDEFIECLKKVTAGNESYNKGYALMYSNGGEYSQYLYNTWWGQYEGYENYFNYYQGVSFDGDEYVEKSSDIFQQTGRKEAMNALIQMVGNNTYRYSKGAATDFKAAQKYFLKGEGVFMANGDWFAEEMKDDAAKSKYTFKMMKTPIVSAIRNRTPSIKSDEVLAKVVQAIDDGKGTAAASGIEGVTEEDYAIIMEARGIIYSLGAGYDSFIPSYAKSKDVACDFLRFMATDKAQLIYSKSTGGASLPFQYDHKKDTEAYAGYSDLQKSRLDMVESGVYKTQTLPMGNNYPLSKFGHLSEWSSFALSGGQVIDYAKRGSLNAADSTSAKAAYDRDIEYWTANNGNKWNDCLRLAGYFNN